MKNMQGRGIQGALGGIQSFGHLVELLKPHFAPSSTLQAPISGKNSAGNRLTASPTQSTTTPFKGGALTWIFPSPFQKIPVVTYGVVGVPTGTPAIYIKTITTTQVTIFSTNSSDARLVHLTATGNPN